MEVTITEMVLIVLTLSSVVSVYLANKYVNYTVNKDRLSTLIDEGLQYATKQPSTPGSHEFYSNAAGYMHLMGEDLLLSIGINVDKEDGKRRMMALLMANYWGSPAVNIGFAPDEQEKEEDNDEPSI